MYLISQAIDTASFLPEMTIAGPEKGMTTPLE